MRIAGTPIRTIEGYLLILMVSVDLVFLGMSLVHHYGNVLEDRRFSINGHGGYGEMFQYAKELSCFLLLSNAAVRIRQPLLFVWSTLFVYLFLTDVFRINEMIGLWLGNAGVFDFAGLQLSKWQLRRVVVAVIGLSLVLVIGFFHRKTKSRSLREDSWQLSVLVVVFLFFGVLVDYLHRILANASIAIYNIFGVVEEWGEMLVMSLLVVAAYLTFIRALRANPHIVGVAAHKPRYR